MREILIAAAVVALSGCATSYQPRGFAGGYTDIRLKEDTFAISYRGNIYTRQDVVEQYTMLRAAELCLGIGSPYFSILGAQGEVAPATIQQAVVMTGSGAVSVSADRSQGMFNARSASMMVRCLAEKPSGDYVDAKLLRDHVRQTYRVGG